MKISAFKRFLSEQFAGAPDWFVKFLQQLNLMTEQTVDALNGKLTIDDNLNQQWQTFTIRAGATADANVTTFQCAIDGMPKGVVVGSVGSGSTIMTSPVQVFWTFDGANVKINSITGLTSGSTYTIGVLVF
jgi:hypothetical protein